MNKTHLTTLASLLGATLLASIPVSAQVFYVNNFESGTMPGINPSPVWKLPPIFPSVYGPGNHYIISNTSSHNGGFSLRFTYEGLNGVCNTCGAKFYNHVASGHDNADYFVVDTGEDLTTIDDISTNKEDDGPKAEPGKFIYDRDRGYSRWEITEIVNQNATRDRLNLRLDKPGVNGETTIKSGDSISITRHCGVDGIVGIKNGANDIHRRSDCNSVILWFGDVTPQAPGSSIYRRAYLKSEVTSNRIRQKLHYLRPDRDGPFQGEIVLFGDSTDGHIYPQLSGVNKYGAPLPTYTVKNEPNFVGLEFERGKWYYVEEQYKAATVKSTNGSGQVTEYNPDGEYRLWFGESGSEPTEGNPTLELTGLTLPPIVGGTGTHISFWGNIQHSTHARGSWYIDDVIINDDNGGDGWNGPVTGNGVNTAAPNPADPG